MKTELLSKRTTLFKIGLILTLLSSAVSGFLHVGVLFLFGFPVLFLFVGIILIWLSEESRSVKFVSSLLPIPTIILGFWAFYLTLPRSESELFLIPNDFRGQIAIYYNQDCGEPLPRVNRQRIYDVAQTNVFITSENKSFGLIDRTFYFVDDSENRTKIPEFHLNKFEEERNEWHWVFSNTELTKTLVGYFSLRGTQNYQGYLISDYLTIENESAASLEFSETQFRHLANSILKTCKDGR
jgi:hypothetical protein